MYSRIPFFQFVIYLVVACVFVVNISYTHEANLNNLSREENDFHGTELASAPPPLYEVELTSLSGDIYINPDYVGKINSIRTLNKNQLLGEKVNIEARTLIDNWKKLKIPNSLSGVFGLVISGTRGIVKVSLPQNPSYRSGSGTLKSISDLFIEFGSLHATFVYPGLSILEPSKYEISLLNTTDNSFTSGDIIVLKDNEAAVLFKNLGSSIVNKDGMLRVSLREADGTFINSDIPAWGYTLVVSETDTGVPAPITADVFGLADNAKVKFNFVSLQGQVINPSSVTMTVKDINKGTEISTITTKISGPQPITVTVTKQGD